MGGATLGAQLSLGQGEPGGCTGSGRSPAFFIVFLALEIFVSTIQTEIEERLRAAAPEVELLLVETVGADTLRLFIDHPNGVTLGLCEQVTHLVSDYTDRYALEVSSPGNDRPLTKPSHFSRFLGRQAKLRLREARDGHKSVTGELVGASEEEVTIAASSGVVAIPYSQIVRSNLVPGD
jgi:ribosome maturation factor RimP